MLSYSETATGQTASQTNAEDSDEESLVSVKQRIQRLEETKSMTLTRYQDGRKKRVPPPVPVKPRSISLRGAGDVSGMSRVLPILNQQRQNDLHSQLPDSQMARSLNDLSLTDDTSGVSSEPNVPPSVHRMLYNSPHSTLPRLRSGSACNPVIGYSVQENSGNTQTLPNSVDHTTDIQSDTPTYNNTKTTSIYSLLLPNRTRLGKCVASGRASIGSMPLKHTERAYYKQQDSGWRPINESDVSRCSSPDICVKYHSPQLTDISKVNTNSTPNLFIDEAAKLGEKKSISKTQIDPMSSSFPNEIMFQNGCRSFETPERKMSIENNTETLSGKSEPQNLENGNQSKSSSDIDKIACDINKNNIPQQESKKVQQKEDSIPVKPIVPIKSKKVNAKSNNSKKSHSGSHHSRELSQEEVEFEEKAKDLYKDLNENDKELLSVLKPNNKRATDYVKSVFDIQIRLSRSTTLQEHLENQTQTEGKENTNEENCSTDVISKEAPTPDQQDNKVDDNCILKKKEELKESIRKKLEALQVVKQTIERETKDINNLGEKILNSLEELCDNPQEKNKYRAYIEDLLMVMRLLMKLSVLLARAENSANCADETRRRLAIEKRDRLHGQYQEAKQLKTDIDRRQEPIESILCRYLPDSGIRDFHRYILMKIKLIIEQQDVEDKIFLAQEQLVVVKRSLPMSYSNTLQRLSKDSVPK
ncbi:protein Shroom1 [Octopus sinensis]|nr:protein Shroom1 [Octopus sinensis]